MKLPQTKQFTCSRLYCLWLTPTKHKFPFQVVSCKISTARLYYFSFYKRPRLSISFLLAKIFQYHRWPFTKSLYPDILLRSWIKSALCWKWMRFRQGFMGRRKIVGCTWIVVITKAKFWKSITWKRDIFSRSYFGFCWTFFQCISVIKNKLRQLWFLFNVHTYVLHFSLN